MTNERFVPWKHIAESEQYLQAPDELKAAVRERFVQRFVEPNFDAESVEKIRGDIERFDPTRFRGAGEEAVNFSKAAVEGAVRGLSSGLRGGPVAAASRSRENLEAMDGERDAPGFFRRITSGFGGIPGPEKVAAMYEDLPEDEKAGFRQHFEDKSDPEASRLTQFSRAVEARTEGAMDRPAYHKTSMRGQVGEGVGQALGMMSTAAIARNPMQAGALMSAQSASSMTALGFDEAFGETGDFNKAFEYATASGAIGMTEAIPMARLFRRLDNATDGRAKNALKNGAIQAIEEAGQEGLQTVLQNLAAKGIWDPSRGWNEQALEGMQVGGGVGALLGAVFGAARKSQVSVSIGSEGSKTEFTGPVEQAHQFVLSQTGGKPAGMDIDIKGGRKDREMLGTLLDVSKAEAELLAEEEKSAQPSEQKAPEQEVETQESNQPSTPEEGELSESEVEESLFDEGVSDPDEEVQATTEPEPEPEPTDAADPEAELQEAVAQGDSNLRRVRVADLKADPKAYQFRSDSDERGTTGRLEGVEEWDESKAGMVVVHERDDGTQYIADGHHRLAKAQDLGVGELNALVYREVDGYSIEDVTEKAAFKNIAEGGATSIDAAKALRLDSEKARSELDRLPRNKVVREGSQLAKLNDDVFGLVVNGGLSERDGAVIGERFEPDNQQAAAEVFRKVEPRTKQEADILASEIAAASFRQKESEQSSLFGDDETESLLPHRVKLIAAVATKLKGRKSAFDKIENNAGLLEEAGNVLAREQNQGGADQAGEALFLLQRLSTEPRYNRLFNEAAAKVADGETVASASGRLIEGLLNETETANAGTGAPVSDGRTGIDPDRKESSQEAGRPEESQAAVEPDGQTNLAGPAPQQQQEEAKTAEPPPAELELTGSTLPADANPGQSDLASATQNADAQIRSELSALTPDEVVAAAERLGLKPGQSKKKAIERIVDSGVTLDAVKKAIAPRGIKKEFGESNKAVSKAEADQLLKDIRAMTKDRLNSGLDPELAYKAMRLSAFYVEGGARKFADYARMMVDALGDWVKPYLRMLYVQVSENPDFDFDGMDDFQTVKATNIDDALSGDSADAADSNTSVEPGSEAQAADGVGAGRVSDGQRGAAGSLREGGKQPAGSGASGTGGRGVSVGNAAAGREGSDSAGAAGTVRTGADGSAERPGSGRIGKPGLGAQRTSDQQPAPVVARPASADVKKQREADTHSAKKADRASIDKMLPLLQESQRDDVQFAEERFLASPKEPGVMFTNGTGTGKTWTGVGIIKRFERQGKNNVLVVAPSQTILRGWVEASKRNGLKVSVLSDTSSNGEGVVLTTYANLGANGSLASRQWDLVVMDESHKLMSSKQSKESAALDAFRALTWKDLRARFRMENRNGIVREAEEASQALDSLKVEQAKANKRDEPSKGYDSVFAERAVLNEKIQEAVEKEATVLAKMHEQMAAYVKENGGRFGETKAVFLSATPFAYQPNVQYAEGFLFSYGERSEQSSGYNEPNPQQQFMVEHFGYRMRYNKLTQPEADVDQDLMARQFNQWLRDRKVLSTRWLSTDFDYERQFVEIDDAVGKKIDDGLRWLSESDDVKLQAAYQFVKARFAFLPKSYLLEAIKARHAVSLIREHLDRGRKVIVFHNYNKGGMEEGALHPFQLPPSDLKQTFTIRGAEHKFSLNEISERMQAQRPDLVSLDLEGLLSPVDAIKAEFDDALVFNGRVPVKKRGAAIDAFNNDDTGPTVMVVQSDAGGAGISLHDTTGKHPRVLINLGLPFKPVDTIQQEGRPIRVGVQSNTLLQYMTTGLDWERFTFAEKIGARSSIAEALSLGAEARDLKEAFISGYEEMAPYAHHPDEGTGGKARDRTERTLSPFEQAKSHYFGNQKRNSRTKNKEGGDYYATPEPLGLKVVEWAGIRPGERVLEPSAGHGAIARFVPEDTRRHYLEPNQSLASRLSLRANGANVMQMNFEDLAATNKYDAIVMNPPYNNHGSTGGKLAIDHVRKGLETHLAPGGRLIAILPDGPSANGKFDKMMESLKESGDRFNLSAVVTLPGVTFVRAGTGVRTRAVVIDRLGRGNKATPTEQIDFSEAKDIKQFFDRIEDAQLPERPDPPRPDAFEKLPKSDRGTLPAEPKFYLENDFPTIAKMARERAGFWREGAFQFKNAKDRANFLQDAEAAIETNIDADTLRKRIADSEARQSVQGQTATEPKAKRKYKIDNRPSTDKRKALDRLEKKLAKQGAPAKLNGVTLSLKEADPRRLQRLYKKLFGKNIVYFQSDNPDAPAGAVIDGNTMFVNIDASDVDLRKVVAHEFTHTVELSDPEAWADIKDAALSLAQNYPEYAARLRGLYAGKSGDSAKLKLKPKKERSAAFRKWFGDSKVVDENSNPRALYHATPNDFDAFVPGGDDVSKRGPAIWMGTQQDYQPAAHNVNINQMASKFKDGVRVMPVYANVRNPLVITDANRPKIAEAYGSSFPFEVSQENRDALESSGFDGVFWHSPVFKNSQTSYGKGELQEVIALRPEQIKSAIGNNGNFDPNDPSILRYPSKQPGSQPVSDDTVTSEFVADAVAEALVDDKKLRYLRASLSPSRLDRVVSKVISFIEGLIDKLRGSKADSTYIRDLAKFRQSIKVALGKAQLADTTIEEVEAQSALLAKKQQISDPSFDSVRIKMGIENPSRTAVDRLWSSVNKLRNELVEAFHNREYAVYGIFDAFRPILDAEKGRAVDMARSGYIALRMATNTGSTIYAMMMHGAPMLKDGFIQKKANSKGLLEILEPVKADVDDFTGWMVAKRAEWLKADGRENLLNDADIKKGLSLAKDPETLARYEKTAKELRAFTGSVLDMAAESGLLSQQNVQDFMQDKYYLPFYRQDADDDEILRPWKKRGASHQDAGIRRLKGGKDNLGDPLENLMLSVGKIVDASAKNYALRRTVLTNPHLFTKARKGDLKHVVQMKKDGKRHTFKVADKRVYAALAALEVPEWRHGNVINASRTAKRLLTTGVTAAPDFMLRNFIRDMAHAWMINEDGMTPGVDSVKGAWDSARSMGNPDNVDPLVEAMLFAGSSFMGGYIYGGDPKADAAALRRALRKKDMSKTGIDKFVSTVATNPWVTWRTFGDAIENANRLAVARAALDKNKSMLEAMYEAKDLMDYSLRGQYDAIAVMADVLPFFNARLQGMYKLAREAAREDGSNTADKVFQNMKGQLAQKGFLLALASVALLAANWDDERYQSLPDYDKDAYWHLFLGDQEFRIPKPFELGVVFGTMPERLVRRMFGADDNADLRKAVGHAIFQTMAMNPLPQIAKPAVEAYPANRDFFRDRDVVNKYLVGNVEASEEKGYRTSPLMIEIGDQFNISPARLEHAFKGYTGTLGTYALGMADFVGNAAGAYGEKKPSNLSLNTTPVVSSFWKDASKAPWTTIYTDEFYQMASKANRLQGSIRIREEEGRDASKYKDEVREIVLLEERKALNRAKRDISELREEMRDVRKDSSMEKASRLSVLDDKQREINTIQREFVKRIEARIEELSD